MLEKINLKLIDRPWRSIPSLYGLAVLAGIQATALALPKSVHELIVLGLSVGDWVQVVTAIGVGITAFMRVTQKKEPTDDNAS